MSVRSRFICRTPGGPDLAKYPETVTKTGTWKR